MKKLHRMNEKVTYVAPVLIPDDFNVKDASKQLQCFIVRTSPATMPYFASYLYILVGSSQLILNWKI